MEYTIPQITEAQAETQRIQIELRSIEAESARSSQAITLAIATGKTPEAADIAKLTAYDERKAELRAKLAAIRAAEN